MSAAATATELSIHTNAMYSGNIRIMTAAGLDPLDGEALIKWVMDNKKTTNTQKNYISSAIAWVKPSTDTRRDAAYTLYKAKIRDLAIINLDRYKEQTFTEREEKKYLKWPEIIKGVKTGYADSDCLDSDKLLMAFYTELPPVRIDYTNMAIYNDKVPEGTKGTYVVLKKEKSYVAITEYKEAKKWGAIINELPKSLEHRLRLYIAGHPEETMLFQYSEKALGCRLTRLFKKYCGRNIGCCVLRHSFISHFLESAPSYRECESMARKMGHSTALQTFYRKLDKKDD
jgi:hypothetical protein